LSRCGLSERLVFSERKRDHGGLDSTLANQYPPLKDRAVRMRVRRGRMEKR
jgi:hypothetical protein